jgi:hypothetical protein
MKRAFICIKGTVVNSKAISDDEWICLPNIKVCTKSNTSIHTDFFGNFIINEVIDVETERVPLEITFGSGSKEYDRITKKIVLDEDTIFQTTKLFIKLTPNRHYR